MTPRLDALTDDELDRYARHIVLRGVGGPGQGKLKRARVAVVGAGGLGAPAALYLAAAGVGSIRLIDDDVVGLSNLQRQVLFATSDVGEPKTKVAAEKLSALNPHCTIDARAQRLDADNAHDLLADVDVVLDGVDDFPARFVINQACHDLGVPLVSGAVGPWQGQVGVFASGVKRPHGAVGVSPCYQCLVPEAPEQAEPCAQAGVIGALTGVVGSAMALEAIKLITGAGEALIGRVWLYDALSGDHRVATLPPDPACPVCGKPDQKHSQDVGPTRSS